MGELTQDRLKEVLRYFPETGCFIWLVNKNRSAKEGGVAGTTDAYGYRSIGIDGKRYKAHRLAWLYAYGQFPSCEIDHISGVRDENRIKNLRSVSSQENSRNARISKNNKSGVCGVTWASSNRKWRANITINRKMIHLGYYATKAAAAAKRKMAEVLYGYHKNHGSPA